MPARKDEESRLARRIRIGQLNEAYGALLTERQREFVRLHHDEDMSFGEIAREFKISRQAVHDAVRQAEAAMEQYETGLGLLAKAASGDEPAGATPEPRSSENRAQLKRALDDLERFRRQLASLGIVYDSAEQARKLESVIEQIRSLTGD